MQKRVFSLRLFGR